MATHEPQREEKYTPSRRSGLYECVDFGGFVFHDESKTITFIKFNLLVAFPSHDVFIDTFVIVTKRLSSFFQDAVRLGVPENGGDPSGVSRHNGYPFHPASIGFVCAHEIKGMKLVYEFKNREVYDLGGHRVHLVFPLILPIRITTPIRIGGGKLPSCP